MYEISVQVEWDAAHRLTHEDAGKCRNLHGHRYKAEVVVGARDLIPDLNWVMNFADLKRVVKELTDKWDHACHLNEQDELVRSLLGAGMKIHYYAGDPTAEAMAINLADWVRDRLSRKRIGVQAVSVTIWETPTCSATWRSPVVRGG